MSNYPDYDDYDDEMESEEHFDCGWDGEDMCGHIGSEHCDVFCPFRRAGILDTSELSVIPAMPPPLDDDIDSIPF